jgi:hypothetical protein
MIKLPDDLFQIFLEYNHQKEILQILSLIDEYKDYRLKKYVYFITDEIKKREFEKMKEVGRIQYSHSIYHQDQNLIKDVKPKTNVVYYNHLTLQPLNYAPINTNQEIVGVFSLGGNLEEFYIESST